LLNAEKIANTYKSVKKEKIDKQTVEKYIGYFKDAFIIREAKRYDLKGRNEIGALRKYYGGWSRGSTHMKQEIFISTHSILSSKIAIVRLISKTEHVDYYMDYHSIIALMS